MKQIERPHLRMRASPVAGADEERAQEGHLHLQCRRIHRDIGCDDRRRAHRLVQHGADEAALDRAGGIGELWPRLEREAAHHGGLIDSGHLHAQRLRAGRPLRRVLETRQHVRIGKAWLFLWRTVAHLWRPGPICAGTRRARRLRPSAHPRPTGGQKPPDPTSRAEGRRPRLQDGNPCPAAARSSTTGPQTARSP